MIRIDHFFKSHLKIVVIFFSVPSMTIAVITDVGPASHCITFHTPVLYSKTSSADLFWISLNLEHSLSCTFN